MRHLSLACSCGPQDPAEPPRPSWSGLGRESAVVPVFRRALPCTRCPVLIQPCPRSGFPHLLCSGATWSPVASRGGCGPSLESGLLLRSRAADAVGGMCRKEQWLSKSELFSPLILQVDVVTKPCYCLEINRLSVCLAAATPPCPAQKELSGAVPSRERGGHGCARGSLLLCLALGEGPGPGGARSSFREDRGLGFGAQRFEDKGRWGYRSLREAVTQHREG